MLEDNGGLTLAANTATLTDDTWNTILKVSTQWNNKNDYHATITDAQNLFGRTQFTLLADVMIEEPSSDKTKTAMRSAFTISTGSMPSMWPKKTSMSARSASLRDGSAGWLALSSGMRLAKTTYAPC